MSFPEYSSYQLSGVAWVGRVPAHWSVTPGRRLFEERRDAAQSDDDQLSATQKYGVIPQRVFMEAEDQKVVLALGGVGNFKHVDEDDFVISLRSFQGGIEYSAYKGCVSPAYTVLRPRCEVVPKFWAYLLKCASYIEALQSVTVGIREGKNISYSQFGSLTLPVPPVSEQRKIADFLDGEVVMIDTLIAEQEKLIALLAEKRQATITHAVTRGLKPKAPTKASGIPWLGDVPAHWDVTRIKVMTASIGQGWSPQCENYPIENPDEWGVLKVGCVNGGQFNPSENKKLPAELEAVPEYSLRRRDLLISRANTRDLVGSAAVVLEDHPNLLLCDKLYRLRLNDECDPQFLAAFLGSNSARPQIELEATGASSSMQNIGQSAILNLYAPRPPTSEQEEIVAFIEAEVRRVNALQDCASRSINLLRERCSALITAAVTGQIDVRNAIKEEETA